MGTLVREAVGTLVRETGHPGEGDRGARDRGHPGEEVQSAL